MIAIQRRAVVDEYRQFQFQRGSVAFDSRGRLYYPHQARFEAVSGRTGVLVEESTTNLLSAAISQGFTSPVNITVTNGTQYTVSMTGTGSITLSGAGTGTVTASLPVTFTANGTTLTLTPDGDTGRVQVEAKAYKTTWHLGGTTRAAEMLTVPTAGVADGDEVTIEAWVYVNALVRRNITNQWPTIFNLRQGTGLRNWAWLFHNYNGTWMFQLRDNSGNIVGGTSLNFASDTDTPDGWHYFAVAFNLQTGAVRVALNGTVRLNTTLDFSNVLPFDRLYLGSRDASFDWLNSFIGPLRISRRARTDQEIADAYAAGTLTADADTTLLLPFTGPDAQRGARVLYVPAVGF